MYRTSTTKLGSWALRLGLPFIFVNPAQAASVGTDSAVVYDEGVFSGSTTILGVPVNGAGSSSSTAGYSSSIVPGLAASGHGEALFGALHATAFSAAAHAGAAQITTQARGQGGAFWLDQVTISSATLTGSAFARATFSLSGGLSSLSEPGGSTGNSTIAATVQINGGTVFSTTGQVVSQNGDIVTNDLRRGQSVNGILDIDPVSSLTGDFVFDIPFEFGTAFQMFATLTTFTQALAGTAGLEASAASNFGSSAHWGGISEVHLADGTVLTGYSISSDSGFDYSNAYSSDPGPVAVPVPATLWLLGSGLLALIGLGRRTKAA